LAAGEDREETKGERRDHPALTAAPIRGPATALPVKRGRAPMTRCIRVEL